MESQQPGKNSSKSGTPHRSGRKRDPRDDSSDNEDASISKDNSKRQEKDEMVDLDVAYMAIFEEGNNEYMKERDSGDSERIPIPQRIYTTFLESIESDVLEYSSHVGLLRQLRHEQSRLKKEITAKRAECVKKKQRRADLEAELLSLREEYSDLQKRRDIQREAEAVVEQARLTFSGNDIIWSVPNVPLLVNAQSLKLLEALNKAVEEKIKELKKKNSLSICCNQFHLIMFYHFHINRFTLLSIFLFVLCEGSSEFYECSDGSQIPTFWMNDGFCDCLDCSDEVTTHVSNTGFFECANELGMDGNKRLISNMYVSDGICDCCDCSDEGEHLIDNCSEVNHRTLDLLEKQLEQEKRGIEEMSKITGTKELLKKVKKQLKSIKRESHSIVASYQSNGGATKEDMKRYQDLQHFQAIFEGVDKLIKSKNKKALKNMFGDHLEFLSLLFHCLHSGPISEQVMKGGTANYFDKTYSIEFCPFRTITQINNKTDTWRKQNDHVRLGGSREEARKIRILHDDSWEYTLIGSQNAWLEEISVPEHLEPYRKRGLHTTQIYRGEDTCIDGSKRVTAVLYECGEKEEIVNFYENGMCNYKMVVKHPVMCSPQKVKQLEEAIEKVHMFLSFYVSIKHTTCDHVLQRW